VAEREVISMPSRVDYLPIKAARAVLTLRGCFAK
jgi:hypothetical protein